MAVSQLSHTPSTVPAFAAGTPPAPCVAEPSRVVQFERDAMHLTGPPWRLPGHRNGISSSDGALHYTLRDHLGSVDLLTDAADDFAVMEPMDHNGDGHPDFIWHDRDAERIKAYLWNPNTNAFDTATARTVRSTDGDRKRGHLFFDANGDGHTDYLYLTKLSTKGRLSTYLANNDGRTPRQVTAITNGLGAVTEIDYETLSRTDHYERLGLGGSATTVQFCHTYLGASGCHPYTRTTVSQANINAFYTDLNGGWNLPSGAQTLGKAGPVLEFTGPVPVVTRVDSSAPKAGSAPGAVDANATSAIEYFYAEAKVQAMGRGLLGFQQLKTKDMQTKRSRPPRPTGRTSRSPGCRSRPRWSCR